ILEPIEFLKDIVPAVYHHHEQYDGSGYPLGLKGEEIPLEARILAVADTYDAMTSDRPYRAALSHEIAVAELRRCAGSQFDPRIVAVFIIEMERRREHQQAHAQAAAVAETAEAGAVGTAGKGESG
ncbi:MAG: hypothetical protein DRI34_14225, partial [Deltaproteobacteria bacterium]